jgi:ribulose bisphosphate carboxylase small subunit
MTQYLIQNRMVINPHPAAWFICRSFDTKREAVAELRALRTKYPADCFRLRRSSIQGA